MESSRSATGAVVTSPHYTLRITDDSAWARLEDADGPWADLCLLASADSIGARDETHGIQGPTFEGGEDRVRLSWELRGGAWSAKRVTIDCTDAGLEIRLSLSGRGRLGDVTLLGGQAAFARGPSGSFWSRAFFATVLPAAPGDPVRVVIPAEGSADATVSGGGGAGRPGWFFTPAPFWFGVTREPIADPLLPPDGRWLGFGLQAAPEEQRFVGFGYRGSDRGFRFVLDYQGQTRVTDTWSSPILRIDPATGPYAGLRGYRDALASAGYLPGPDTTAPRPDWWSEPMFCGWGAQCASARADGRSHADAPLYSTQARYDGYLASLESGGIVPGTVVIDDGWQAEYARPEPDRERWPDLAGWIRERHLRGQRVLLWWKAWDPQGLPPDWCVRTADGGAVAVDVNAPEARRAVAEAVATIVGPDGYDADGLKIDFTGHTPNGVSLRHRPGEWGVGLLRRLLTTVRAAAKGAKPDALLIGQVPEPSLAQLLDMIRLNDILRLDDPIPQTSILPQMRYRASVARAACPDHLIDTDDWCIPDLATWRAYAELKPRLGVPALYYADQLDLTGERLTEADYALLRRTWADYREREGLSPR